MVRTDIRNTYKKKPRIFFIFLTSAASEVRIENVGEKNGGKNRKGSEHNVQLQFLNRKVIGIDRNGLRKFA